MLNKQDDCACPQCSTAALLEKLLFYDWSTEGPQIKKTLLLLLSVYLGSDICDVADPETRQTIAFHVHAIHGTIEELEKFQLKTVKN